MQLLSSLPACIGLAVCSLVECTLQSSVVLKHVRVMCRTTGASQMASWRLSMSGSPPHRCLWPACPHTTALAVW